MTGPEAVSVTVVLDGDGSLRTAGTAYIQERRGAVSTTFTYAPEFLAAPRAFAISPDLPLLDARHRVTALPGAIGDSAPDRWGRNLVAKRIRGQARAEGRPAPTIREVDYLLGVSDLTRQGALRFAADPAGPFLATDADVPRLIELPRLLHAADAVTRDDDPDSLAAVEALLDAGTGSLGAPGPRRQSGTETTCSSPSSLTARMPGT